MPKPRRPHLIHEKTRHGKRVWYLRVGKGPRVRLNAAYGTKEFNAEYDLAIGTKQLPPPKAKSDTLRWLIGLYMQSSAWSGLSPATRRQRENLFKHVLATSGDFPVAAISEQAIEEGKERRQDTPAQANNFIKAMRGLFIWAVKAKKADIDPTAKVDWLAVDTKGFHAWTEKEVTKFERHWPLGTRERLAMDLLLYTGLRRGDAVRLGPEHVHDGVFEIETEKTGTVVEAPILAPLQRSIDALPSKGTTFIETVYGRPMVKESFGTWFRNAAKAAGVPGSCHGLRKAGATRAANNGATERQIEAIFGWTGGKMAAHYTRKANRKRMARDAMHTMESADSSKKEGESGDPIPAPEEKIPRT